MHEYLYSDSAIDTKVISNDSEYLVNWSLMLLNSEALRQIKNYTIMDKLHVCQVDNFDKIYRFVYGYIEIDELVDIHREFQISLNYMSKYIEKYYEQNKHIPMSIFDQIPELQNTNIYNYLVTTENSTLLTSKQHLGKYYDEPNKIFYVTPYDGTAIVTIIYAEDVLRIVFMLENDLDSVRIFGCNPISYDVIECKFDNDMFYNSTLLYVAKRV